MAYGIVTAAISPPTLRGHRPKGLRGSVEGAGLQWEGRLHSGLDDARNTARLLLRLIDVGAVLVVTGASIKLSRRRTLCS